MKLFRLNGYGNATLRLKHWRWLLLDASSLNTQTRVPFLFMCWKARLQFEKPLQIDGSEKDCSISIANALEILQSYTEPSICTISLNSADLFQILCMRGMMDLLGIRKTVGTLEVWPPPRKDLERSFEDKHRYEWLFIDFYWILP